MGIKADGIAGPNTTIKFYKKNGLKKDKTYHQAVAVKKDEHIRKILQEPYPSKSQLISDLGTLNFGSLGSPDYKVAEVDGRKVIFGKTVNGARVGAYYKEISERFSGKTYHKILDTSLFTNLDEIQSGDWSGAMSVSLKKKKFIRGGTIILTSDDAPIKVHDSLDFSSDFRGIIIDGLK